MKVDCVVIGYNEGRFDDYRLVCERSGPGTPEWQIFRKEHLVINGVAMPWLDAFSVLRNRVTGRHDRYQIGEVANLATLYLTSFLRRHGLNAEPVPFFSAERGLLMKLLAGSPAVVAITTTFYVDIVPVVEIVNTIRAHSPDSHIVVGGPLIDNLCRDGSMESLQDLFFAMGADSYVWESQGESALMSLVQAVSRGGSPDGLPNIIQCADGVWKAGPRLPEANDLDAAAIDWSLFPEETIGATAQLRTARSCAFKCSFCDYPTRAGALTAAAIDTVRAELRQLADRGVRYVVFVDDTFNVPPKRFKQLCKMMIEEDLGLRWYSYFRCSNARDEESFDLAAASGCSGVFLGIESGDPNILLNMNKLAQDSQYRIGIQRLKERGVTTFASIIVGFPGETERTVQNTIDFLNETAPDYWRAQAWWANTRSPVFRQKELFGIEGRGYRWTHRTMSSGMAADLTDWMFDQVSESVWLPLYELDFWSLPYLAGKGVSASGLKPLLKLTKQIMSARDSGTEIGRAQVADLETALGNAVSAIQIDPPRFSF